LTLFASFAYFYQGGGWNQNSRLDLTRAIVERHSLRITPYEENTGDKAKVGAEYYCDKAPGLSLLAVPPYAVTYALIRAVVADKSVRPSMDLLLYVSTVLTSGLAAALLGLALFRLAGRWGCGPGGAALVAAAAMLGSPLWTYATVLWGHVVAAAFLVGAFAAAQALGTPGGRARDLVYGAAVGLGGGLATVVEYPAAPAALMLAVLAVVQLGGTWRARVLPVAGALAGAALACAAVLLAYNAAAFGGPFHIGYQSQANFKSVDKLFHAPTLDTVRKLLTGEFRGLLPLAPILGAAPVGLVLLLRAPGRRAAAVAAISIAVYYLLMNASYEGWHGGWNYGPRDLAPAIPFLALLVAPVWARGGPVVRAALLVLFAWGFVLALMAVSTTAQPPDSMERPIRDLIWPAFRSGRLSLNPMGYHDAWADPGKLLSGAGPRASWNLGQKLGLSGLASLLPLAGLWLALAGAWLVRRRTSTTPGPAAARG
jgi:hypothetical protein